MTPRGWRMSRPISAAYLERKLRVITGVLGDNPLPDLADLNGLIVLENDRPEWRFPAGDFMFSAVTQVAPGGVGNASYFGLLNPVGSGYIVTTTRWWARPGVIAGTSVIALAYIDPSLFGTFSNVNAKVPRDTRLGITQVAGAPQPVFRNNAVPGVINQICSFDPRVESYRQPIVMLPNSLIVMLEVDPTNGTQQVNGSLGQACVDWYQRPVEGSSEIR